MTSPRNDRLSKYKDAPSGRDCRQALERIASALREARRVLVTAHVNPDGDAVGSAAALALALQSLGKEAEAVFDSPPPAKLLPVLGSGAFTVLEDAAARARLTPPDWWVLLDTCEPERAGGLQDLIFASGQKRACVDHHLSRSPGSFDLSCVVPEAPSTANLVLALIDLLRVNLSRGMAQALWIGMATDTGWFRYENTSPWVLEDAARLAELEIPVPWLYRQVYEEIPAGRMRLLGKVLGRIETHFDGALVLSSTGVKEVQAEGLTLADLDGVVDHLKSVQRARFVALIVETGERAFKLSLRAQEGCEVESIARKLGGGGHAKAAGCRFSGPYETLHSFLLAEVKAKLSPIPPLADRRV